jgi:hypothetical protein
MPGPNSKNTILAGLVQAGLLASSRLTVRPLREDEKRDHL